LILDRVEPGVARISDGVAVREWREARLPSRRALGALPTLVLFSSPGHSDLITFLGLSHEIRGDLIIAQGS
jgi:hypothetical protein